MARTSTREKNRAVSKDKKKKKPSHCMVLKILRLRVSKCDVQLCIREYYKRGSYKISLTKCAPEKKSIKQTSQKTDNNNTEPYIIVVFGG